MAGPLYCVWLDWRHRRRGDAAADVAGLALARLTNWALTGGIVLGFVLLAARWHSGEGRYATALAAIPRSRLWFGGAELLFFFACMGLYVAFWNRWRRWRPLHALLAVAAATNLLLHFPALFAIISILETRPEMIGQTLDRAGYQRMLLDGEVMARVFHVWFSSAAVSGVVLMQLGLRLRREEALQSGAAWLIRWGAVAALAATALQIPSGFWLTLKLPESARTPLLGGDLLATALFGLSVVVALALMHLLAGVALGNDSPREIRRALVALAALVILMVGTRCRIDARARRVMVAQMATQNTIEITPDPAAARDLQLVGAAFQ